MQRKTLHHPVDNSTLRRRIRPQPFAQTAEESQQLRYDHINQWCSIVSYTGQAGTVDGDVQPQQEICGNAVSDNYRLHPEILLIQFTNEVAFVSPDRGVGRKEADDKR